MSSGVTFPLVVLATIPNDLTTLEDAVREDMALMHNVFIRSLNAVYYHCAVAPAADIDLPSFLTYIQAFTDFVKHHHKGEELYLFPRLAKDIPALDTNIEEHKPVLEFLIKLESFTVATKEAPGTYDPSELREIVETYATPLYTHLSHEVDTLKPELLREAITTEELDTLIKEEVAWVMQHCNPSHTLPFAYGGHNRKTNSLWPSIPLQVKAALPAIAGVDPAIWKFCPYDPVGGEVQVAYGLDLEK